MKFSTAFNAASSFVGFASVAVAQRARVVYSCTVPNTAAITFDDGPYNYNRDIVNMLDNAGAKGTFFLNGNNYGCIYDEQNQNNIRYLVRQGHQAASHTWEHSDLTTLSWDELHDTMYKTEQAILRIAGVKPAFMRPPYGNTNDQVAQVSGIRGQTVVIWDLDSGDSVGASVQESEGEYDDAVSRHPSTILALNHETHSTSAYNVLPYAIEQLQNAGYNLVTVAECLGMEPYQQSGGADQGEWTC